MTLEELQHEVRKQAKLWAEANAQRVYLEHFRKSKLAILMKQYALEGHEAVSAQEREARADQEYIDVLEGLKAATEAAEKLIAGRLASFKLGQREHDPIFGFEDWQSFRRNVADLIERLR